MRRLQPIAYMERTRDYYLALGYDNAYVWACHDEVPFARLPKPLGGATLALITTAAPFRPACGDQGPGAPYNAAAKFFEVYALPIAGSRDVRISHVAYDRRHTRATDRGSYFPLAALEQAAASGRIGAVAPRFIGLPTDRSQQKTRAVYAPAVLNLCREDHVDAAVLVANCPVCHQSVSLVARHLEVHGIPTVVLGCARDIVEHCGVPRFLFSDFPLGNAAGKPDDPESQRAVLLAALNLLETARRPRTTVVNPEVWADDDTWKNDYCDVTRLSAAARADLRARFDEHKTVAKALR